MFHALLIVFTVTAVEIAVGLVFFGLIRQVAGLLDRLDVVPGSAPVGFARRPVFEGQEPAWWPSFERQFAAYVESRRF
jgi:hypothetical protein